MSGLNNKKYLDAEGLIKFWEICCANFPARDGRGASGTWAINITGNAATATNASAANKLNSNEGSTTKPVYFADGVPKQCNDLIDVNISGNAATADEADKWSTPRNIKLTGGVTGNVDIDGSENVEIATTVVSTAHTHNQYYDKTTTQSPNTVYAGPSSGTIAGMASFRTLVTKDIPDLSGIYLPKSGGIISGNGADLLGINRIDGNPAIVFYHNNSTMGRLGFNTAGDAVAQIGGEYKTLLHEGNFNIYSPKLDGTGATGTWNISITGNATTASSATKLTTPRTIWGQSFNGESNVAGSISGVTAIYSNKPQNSSYNIFRIVPYNNSLLFQVASNDGTSKAGKLAIEGYEGAGLESLYFGSTLTRFSGNVTIGGTTASEKLEVNGNVKATTFIGNLTGIASKVAVGTGTGSQYRPIVVTDGSNSLYTAGTGTGKPQYNYSTGDVKAKSFTVDGGSFNGNLAGNATTATSATTATTATNLTNEPVLAVGGTNSKQITVKAGEKTSDPFTVPYASEAGKIVGTLTLKTPAETISFNGAGDNTFEVTAAKLGLTKAVLYLGKTTTALSDGATTNPITIDNKSVTVTNGNIVIDSSDSREYIWNGSKWEKFGIDGDAAAGNYKPIQTAVSSPSASGNSTSFIDTISQDANGKITATKKNVNFSGYATQTWVGNNYLPLAGGTMTGNISYNHTGTAGSAKGISYKFGGVVAGEIGGYYASGKLNTLYLGWGTSPWLSANSLSVSENALTYKGTNVSLEGHTHSYLPLTGGGISGPLTINSYATSNAITKISDLTNGLVVGTSGVRDNWGMAFWTEGNGYGYIQQQAFITSGTTYPICLQPFGGNVVIGGKNSEEKLHVHGNVKATKFIGALQGNADTATTATKIGTYTADNIFVRQSRPDNGFNIDEIELFGMRDIQPSSEITRTGTFPFDGWGSLMSFNGQNYFVQFATQGTSNGMYFRSAYGGGVKLTDKPWVKFLDSSNYSSYALPLTGGTLTGGLTINKTTDTNLIYLQKNGTNVATVGYENGWGAILQNHKGGAYITIKDDDSIVASNPITATKFIGALQGNATTATKATQDSDGNAINTTYLKKSGGTLSGDLSILFGDTDKFVMWDYDGDGTAGASWRIGAKGTGSSNTNYFTIQSGTSSTTTTTWTDVLNIGQNDFTVYFDKTPKVGSTNVSLEGHGHNYAGSSAAGGPATKVVCSAATSDTYRPILVTNESNGVCYTTKVKLNYSTGIITATNFITTSDRRMKTNIVEIDDASKSLELGFYEFDYKTGGHSAGHIAQDVREVLPEFVHGKETETENLSVDYTGLHSIQIKALKDKVETLETENKELRERLEKLEALIEKLV